MELLVKSSLEIMEGFSIDLLKKKKIPGKHTKNFPMHVLHEQPFELPDRISSTIFGGNPDGTPADKFLERFPVKLLKKFAV